MDLKPGFEDAAHPWIKLVMVENPLKYRVIYGKMIEIKNGSALLNLLWDQPAFDFWWPIRFQDVNNPSPEYEAIAGRQGFAKEGLEVPCIIVPRSAVFYSGVVTCKHTTKKLDKVKKEQYVDGMGSKPPTNPPQQN